MKEEYCIMPCGLFWLNKRYEGLVRHEVFFGPYRQKSIDLGLVVFLKPDMHNESNYAVHCKCGHKFDLMLKQAGQKAAMKEYGWNTEKFIQEFGKNYLED